MADDCVLDGAQSADVLESEKMPIVESTLFMNIVHIDYY